MKVTTVTMGLVIALAAITSTQTASTDDQQIRGLIAKYDTGQRTGMATKDVVFWSGAYKRPTVGSEQGEEVSLATDRCQTVSGSQRSKTTVVRIEIAKSGDLAYEFSNSEVSFNLKNGKKESFPNSLLRVWRKEAGQWKIAAQFARPL